jgi:NAD(P)-dependent dehydrogenase (short-subunit alcohol dehydrogenase family)
MADNDKIAIITGGASGIGLAVGESLSARKGWTIYLLDRDEAKGQAAARRLGTHFYKVDVAVYASLASAFTSIFAAHGKLNFVFANAGIALDPEAQHAQAPTEMLDDMENETLDGPPEAPSMDMIAVNRHSVIYTTVLAQHYFRKCSADDGPRGIVITASSASLYASATAPMYSASKHGVLGWMRSIAANAWRQDRVAVNAICPGIVQTNILPAEMYKVSFVAAYQGS